jgi:hypothetical protein
MTLHLSPGEGGDMQGGRWLSQPHPSARAALAESGTVCLSGKGEMPRRPATKARAAAHVRITIS